MRVEVTKGLRVRVVASDIAGHRRIIDTAELIAAAQLMLTAPLDQYVDGGALWLEFDAVGGELRIRRRSDLDRPRSRSDSPRRHRDLHLQPR